MAKILNLISVYKSKVGLGHFARLLTKSFTAIIWNGLTLHFFSFQKVLCSIYFEIDNIYITVLYYCNTTSKYTSAKEEEWKVKIK